MIFPNIFYICTVAYGQDDRLNQRYSSLWEENRNLPSLTRPNLKMDQLSKILRVTTVTLESVKQNFTEMLG